MGNQYFPHMKNHDPSQTKRYLHVQNRLREMRDINILLTVSRNVYNESVTRHPCFPKIDFSPYMELADPDELLKNVFLSSCNNFRYSRPSTWFRKYKSGPYDTRLYLEHTRENRLARAESTIFIDLEGGLSSVSNKQFSCPKENFDGKPIFPPESCSVATLPI